MENMRTHLSNIVNMCREIFDIVKNKIDLSLFDLNDFSIRWELVDSIPILLPSMENKYDFKEITIKNTEIVLEPEWKLFKLRENDNNINICLDIDITERINNQKIMKTIFRTCVKYDHKHNIFTGIRLRKIYMNKIDSIIKILERFKQELEKEQT